MRRHLKTLWISLASLVDREENARLFKCKLQSLDRLSDRQSRYRIRRQKQAYGDFHE